jgi:hypothetical protein
MRVRDLIRNGLFFLLVPVGLPAACVRGDAVAAAELAL